MFSILFVEWFLVSGSLDQHSSAAAAGAGKLVKLGSRLYIKSFVSLELRLLSENFDPFFFAKCQEFTLVYMKTKINFRI